MMKKEFKNTKLGGIPLEWDIYRLKKLVANENDIVAGPFGSNLKVRDYRTGGVPIIRLQNIERNKFINKDIKHTSPEKAEELKYHSYQAGDLVLAKLGNPIGKTCLVPEYMRNGLVVADVVRIRLSPQKADKYFIEYLLNSRKCLIQLQMETIGSTRPRVNISQVRNLEILLPPLAEQKKIAEVLSTVDRAIDKVDEAIEKTQRLKKGLMQQLLTRGIGHKEFRETEIGRIPKVWSLKRISEIVTHCQYGLSIKLSEIGRYPIIKMDNIANGYVLSKKLKYVDLEEKTFRCFRLDKGDILFNRTNSYELVGRTGIFSLDGDYVFASYLIRLKPDVEMIHPLFLNIYLIFSNRRIRQLATRAVHQANINATTLQKVKIPLPPLSEQEKIVDILSAVYRKLELLNERKIKLERIKKGLMNDLLTGRKRVKLDS